jgi:hypothetical protein
MGVFMIIKKIKLAVIDRKTNKIVKQEIVEAENLDIEKLAEKISLEIAKLRKDYPYNLYYIHEGVFDEFLINDYDDFYYDNFYSDQSQVIPDGNLNEELVKDLPKELVSTCKITKDKKNKSKISK